MAAKRKINLKIRNTEKIVFDGQVDRISSFNDVGPFDVYPQHANFISIIRKHLDLYNDGKKIKGIDFERAVLKIKKDVAKIFLGIDVLQLEKSEKENGTSPPSNNKK